ncbi:Nucleolar and spindle-associated protein 1 [Microtus ochrogaster]|uniref:Nucleolar and spindle-associated protein 1 n=1 Tax=Microtus ochrogaster TaxID=79684 RepID=A0A8J6L5H7_MICOH|nr:Nucleolar and spindle-associated protein 1 [Microtus ochrogaster]
MTVPSAEELDSFKYSDLQNLAKKLGLRANLRADKLLRALKAHLNPEIRKENKNQDENQSSAFSHDETEIQIICEEQAERGPVDHVTKTRRKRKTDHEIPNFQDHSAIKRSDPTTLQNQEKQENQDLRTSTQVSSLPDQSQEDRSATSSGRNMADFLMALSMIAFRFSAATKDNEHKYSLTKTPARKSPCVTLTGSASKGQAVFRTPKLKTTERNSTTAVVTPFKLAAEAAQTPGSSKKPVFDLQASLSRPLNYKPHKGKLKPWGQSKENSSLKEDVSRVSFHRRTYKQPHLHTREEQRKKHEQERKERKAKVLDARRNLVMTKAQ